MSRAGAAKIWPASCTVVGAEALWWTQAQSRSNVRTYLLTSLQARPLKVDLALSSATAEKVSLLSNHLVVCVCVFFFKGWEPVWAFGTFLAHRVSPLWRGKRLKPLDSHRFWTFTAWSLGPESICTHGPEPRTEPGTYNMCNKNLPDEWWMCCWSVIWRSWSS